MPAQNIAVDHASTGLVTARVARAERISPSFVRLTLEGEQLQGWRDLGFDQWFRLAIPVAGEATRFDRLASRYDVRGYLKYLTLPRSTRPAIRNYTVRSFDRSAARMEVDFVIHNSDPQHAGVAAPWAATLPVGAAVALIDQGCGYRPVEDADTVVIVSEESALPAAIGILRDLPATSAGYALLEVPHRADEQPIRAPEGVAVRWILRERTARPGAAALEELRGLPPLADVPVSGFVAGEQQLASLGRKHLVNVRGLDRGAVDFCGYWRQS